MNYYCIGNPKDNKFCKIIYNINPCEIEICAINYGDCIKVISTFWCYDEALSVLNRIKQNKDKIEFYDVSRPCQYPCGYPKGGFDVDELKICKISFDTISMEE